MADKTLKKVTQPYDYGDYMTKALNNYISNRVSFKSSNKELSDKYAEEIYKLSMIFKTKENRLKVLCMSIFAEIDWLRENDHVKYKEQEYNLYFAKSILMDQANAVYREFSFSYRLWNTIKDASFSEGSTTEKAIKHYIKNQKKRTGKDSPIDEMIKNDILITPFLGYSTYLTRNNMTIWEYAKTVIPNIRVLDSETDIILSRDTNEDERIHQRFFPMIEYVYKHEKFNYISNRINRFGSNEERMKKREAEKEERRKEKTKAYINREMERAFKQHNKWACLGHPDKLSVFPRCYKEYISNNENIGNNLVILAVSKRNGSYIHGYLNDLQKSPIGFTLKNPYIYKTMDEAKDAIAMFKKEGVILDGEPVYV